MISLISNVFSQVKVVVIKNKYAIRHTQREVPDATLFANKMLWVYQIRGHLAGRGRLVTVQAFKNSGYVLLEW
jgi:hypothetical protein